MLLFDYGPRYVWCCVVLLRSAKQWDIVWACIRRVLGLPFNANAKSLVGLRAAAKAIGVPHTSLYGYFWGINGTKGGKAITAKQVTNFENKLSDFVQSCRRCLEEDSTMGRLYVSVKEQASQCSGTLVVDCIHLIKTENAGTAIVQKLGDRHAFKGVHEDPHGWALRSCERTPCEGGPCEGAPCEGAPCEGAPCEGYSSKRIRVDRSQRE